MLLYVYFFMLGRREISIYAPSEEKAREKFKEYFGVPAGDLVKRENW